MKKDWHFWASLVVKDVIIEVFQSKLVDNREFKVTGSDRSCGLFAI